ncbi:MAG: universal stress protein [Acidobacteria bacterium]|nr:universal stress protein [Acidobacteriota bacterium]
MARKYGNRDFSAAEIPMLPPSDVGTLPAQYIDDIGRASREKAEAVVEEALSRFNELNKQNIKVSSKVVVDSAREAIIEEAESWGADLIIVGSASVKRLETVSPRFGLAGCFGARQVLCRNSSRSGTMKSMGKSSTDSNQLEVRI